MSWKEVVQHQWDPRVGILGPFEMGTQGARFFFCLEKRVTYLGGFSAHCFYLWFSIFG
jgi:hypothetical protein